MYFLLTYITYWLLFFSCNHSSGNDQKTMNNDSVFKSWNQATLFSLQKQSELAKDSMEINLYENTTLAFKAFVRIDRAEDVNDSSVRYRFIKEVLKNRNTESSFYIVEANRSGEQVEIRNYLVYPHAANQSDVVVCNFMKGKWVMSSVVKKMDISLNENLQSYRKKFRSGFNQDDVIISRFIDDKVTASEYYLYSTLSDVGNFKKLLSLR